MSALVRWSPVDHHGDLLWAVGAGFVAAVALAVFGLPPVDLHSPLHRAGIMDPLCGMTRGVRLTLRGDLGGAARYNPAAPLLPVLGLAVGARWLWGAMTGRWLAISLRRSAALVAVIVVLVAALWIRQQASAALLMAR